MQHLWSHARRGLKEMFDSNASPIAKAGLKRIAQLYQIEDKIRGAPPATRQFVRWTESAPLVNSFGVWLDEQRSRVSPRSRLGEKLTYIANQWDGLLVFLYDGRVEMDSNFVENRIRPIKLTAKIGRSLCHLTAGRCNYGSFQSGLCATRRFSRPRSPRISVPCLAA